MSHSKILRETLKSILSFLTSNFLKKLTDGICNAKRPNNATVILHKGQFIIGQKYMYWQTCKILI